MAAMDAVRQDEQYHRCVCILIHEVVADGVIVSRKRDHCGVMQVPMDQAFCDSCEQSDHHLLPNQAAEIERGRTAR